MQFLLPHPPDENEYVHYLPVVLLVERGGARDYAEPMTFDGM